MTCLGLKPVRARRWVFPVTGCMQEKIRWCTWCRKAMASEQNTGNFDHVAFSAVDFSGMRECLRERGIKFREQQVPASLARQMFFEDPNKVMIELNFPSGSCR